jgi:hypothetical protein
MKPLIVDDLDAIARRGLDAGTVPTLSSDLHIVPKCHPDAGLKNTRSYEGENFLLTCSTCNLFVMNLKVAKE